MHVKRRQITTNTRRAAQHGYHAKKKPKSVEMKLVMCIAVQRTSAIAQDILLEM